MKKQEIKKDLIREKMISMLSILNDNPKKFIQYTSVFVILLLTIIFYNNSQHNKKNTYNLNSSISQNKYTDGDKDLALLNFKKILNDYSSSESYNQAYIYTLNDAVENNDLDKIKDLIENSHFKTKDNTLQALIYNIYANYYLDINNNDKAIKYYNKAIYESDITDHILKFKLNLLYLYYEIEDHKNYEDLLSTINIDDIKSYQLKNKYEQLPSISN